MLKRMHGLPVSRLTASGDAITVVQFGGTIQAEPHAKAFRGKKPAPLIVEQDSVRLHSVEYALILRLMLALQAYNFSKIIQSQ